MSYVSSIADAAASTSAAEIFADEATRSVLGVPELLRRFQPDSQAANRTTVIQGPFRTREEWSAFHGRIQAVERFAADQEAVATVRAHLQELPDLRGILLALQGDFQATEGDFFLLKRFAFHAVFALEALEPLQRVCQRQAHDLRSFLAAIHPEEALSARFLINDAHDPRLTPLRAAVRDARKAAATARRALESQFADVLKFDIHGLGSGPANFSGAPGLKKQGHHWVLDDPELSARETELKVLQADHDLVIQDVLQRLAAIARNAFNLLESAFQTLLQADFDLTRLRLRDALGGCFPVWTEADHPPVIEDGYAIDIPDAQRVSIVPEGLVVVTGPNMGGKSSLLRLIGLCHWCLHHGMPAPARRCELGGADHVVYVGADLDTHVPGLSSFGREVRRLVDWWPAQNVVWLLDEPGRGTHPEEGAAIAAEVIEARRALGDHLVVATHFPRLTAIPGATCMRIAGIVDVEPLIEAAHGTQDVSVALRRAMDYRVVPGDSVPRDARIVARALGLPIKDHV